MPATDVLTPMNGTGDFGQLRGTGAEMSADAGTVHARVQRLLERIEADVAERFGLDCEATVVHQNVTGSTVDLRVRIVPSVAQLSRGLNERRTEYDASAGFTADGEACVCCRLDLGESGDE